MRIVGRAEQTRVVQGLYPLLLHPEPVSESVLRVIDQHGVNRTCTESHMATAYGFPGYRLGLVNCLVSNCREVELVAEAP